ncbi:MAG: anti-sigma factor [Gemmataceae bacterium]
MDCKTARILLHLDHPGAQELDAGEAEALEHHLHECPECAQVARAERAFERRVAQAMVDVPIPPLLREKLHERLEAETGAERRGRLRRQAFYVAAAASLLIGALVGLEWYRNHQLVSVDLIQAQGEEYAQLINPSRNSLDQWLVDHQLGVQPPEDFNFDLLKGYYLTEYKGKRVAMLEFSDGQQRARVYLLRGDQFDLAALAAGPQEAGSGCRAEVRWDADNPRRAFLIFYTGDSLKPFLVTDSKRTA